jgi:hypothetical protein
MRGALVGFSVTLLVGCGTELTDLIPALPPPACVDGTTFTGQGLLSPDVATDTGLTLNGNASATTGALRVTSALRNAVGSAYFAQPLIIDESTSLFAHFSQRIGGGDGINGADGLAFVLQSSSQGSAALGLDGGGMGFQNISPSIAFELDTYPNPPDPIMAGHVAIMLNGEIDSAPLAFAAPPFVLNDGVTHYTWVDYDAATYTWDVYVGDQPSKPGSPLISHSALSLPATLGTTFYAGFSASAGERFNDHDLIGSVWIGTSNDPKCP